MTHVPAVLLNHVHEDPAQRHRVVPGPGTMRGGESGLGAVLLEMAAEDRPRPRDARLPQSPQVVRSRSLHQMPVPVRIRAPIRRGPRLRPVAADDTAEPEVLDVRQVGEHAAQRHRGRREGAPQLGDVEPADLPRQRLAQEVDVADHRVVFIGDAGRVGAVRPVGGRAGVLERARVCGSVIAVRRYGGQCVRWDGRRPALARAAESSAYTADDEILQTVTS